MFKGHPKGLYVAFFANMGERFGFYTMMAILVLFLQAKYGLTEEKAGDIYSWFYFGIYAMALIGGILADATKRYKTVILLGIIIMFIGYIVMAIPGMALPITLAGLFTIAFGNGLFKGNMQAVVGQLYDDPKYSSLRDSAFMIFYMGINAGAFLAPFAATGIRNWILKAHGFLHDGSLPALCHQVLDGTIKDTGSFQALANKVSLNGSISDIKLFAQDYLDVFSKGYNYAFAIAAGAMVISLLVYIIFNKALPNKEKVAIKDQSITNPEFNYLHMAITLGVIGLTLSIFHFLLHDYKLGLAVGLFTGFVSWIFMASTKDERPRVLSLVLVFFVVIFFWMSFHQNGLTLTFFARDYTAKQVGPLTNLIFTLPSLLSVIGAIAGLVILFGKNRKIIARLIGLVIFSIGAFMLYYVISNNKAVNDISPEIFQSFNPLFIVSLTFIVLWVFSWLNEKGIEPSTPRKIGIGMAIAAFGFILIMLPSFGVLSPAALNGLPVPDSSRVSPYWLVNSYLILTIAELFLSPMGLSFVSKVAPPRFQGLMQGGWLLATAVGNKFLFVGSYFWPRIELWQLWGIFVVCCLLSAIFIFTIMKRLENATKS